MDKAKVFEEKEACISVTQDSVKAILQAQCVFFTVHSHGQAVSTEREEIVESSDGTGDDTFIPAVEQLAKDPSLIPDDILDPKEPVLESVFQADWRKLQIADINLWTVIHAMEENKDLIASEMESQELRIFAREQKKLELAFGIDLDHTKRVSSVCKRLEKEADWCIQEGFRPNEKGQCTQQG